MGITHITTMAAMTDQASPLTRDNVREEAGEILLAIDGSRHHKSAFEANWRQLWQLVREARAASLPMESSTGGPWHFRSNGKHGINHGSTVLAAGDFILPIWPSEALRSGVDLPRLLNWAIVPIPGRPSLSDQDAGSPERARDAAERRREEAELFRRKSEEGRVIAETLRTRGEEFRDEDEGSRGTAERLRDSQESGREVAESAREIAETLRSAAEDARAAVNDARAALGEVKDLAKKQRIVLERQEKALAAFEERVRNS